MRRAPQINAGRLPPCKDSRRHPCVYGARLRMLERAGGVCPLVMQIAERHDRSARRDGREPEQGSCFVISLPLA